MRFHCYILLSLSFILISSAFQPVCAQLGFDLKIDKPAPYDNRTLRSEKTPEKQASASKKFLQNLVTHYNYFFNASNKLNDVIDRAKGVHKDDYNSLLSFYNYSLDVTAQDKFQLDSVIYKSKTGIVLHDLRNDWIDNLYLLWGAAYFLEKKFDSASLMFQFINYSFAEKEKDGYYKYIGSNLDGNNALTISTKEKTGLLASTASRNNAFIWQIRTQIETGNLAQAGSLIATLKDDPFFPKRLNDDLEEVQAYWFYKQNMWDSSATHLEKALTVANSKQEKARWEYLAAQMFEKSGKTDEAEKLYTKVVGETTDPVMSVYARLNLVRLNKSGGENYIDKNIAELLKMARRDQYEDYRDIIYYMAAQMELARNNFAAAQQLLIKAAKYNNGNLSSKNNAFLLIADLSYDQKKYLQAASFYDSIQINALDTVAMKRVEDRKDILKNLVAYDHTISLQDSLQKIAAMPEAERNAYINKLVKHLRKQQGLKDSTLSSGSSFATNPPVDLFSPQKGDWYFYNANLRSQGAAQFKQVWGNRPNVDNWRRFSDVSQQLLAKAPNNTRPDANNVAIDNSQSVDNTPSFEKLSANLPLTPEQLQKSNDSVKSALFNLGTLYMNKIEDYPSAIETFEELRRRFPDYNNMNEVLYHLYYAYKKTGDNTKAEQMKSLLMTQGANSRFAAIIATGKDPSVVNNKTPEITKTYEDIYEQFIEGKFDEAEAAKKVADSIYKTNYWEPQLLYIEAVYHIRQRDDSVAKNILQTLINQSSQTPLAAKAQNLLSVLNRRAQIEAELTRYQIPQDTTQQVVMIQRQTQTPLIQNPVTKNPAVVKKDSLINQPKNNVALITQKKDTVANVVSTSVKKPDTVTKKPVITPKPYSVYTFNPSSKHYVMIILDKVDPMFANEVKNAFFRYNREAYYNRTFDISSKDLDADRKLVLISGFNDVQDAVDYAMKVKKIAANEIIPWLKADKYSFSIMTDANLDILSQKKDLNEYKKFLDQNLPGKF